MTTELLQAGADDRQSWANCKGQHEGTERQCHGGQGPNTKGSTRAWKGNVMTVKGQTQRAARGHGKAMSWQSRARHKGQQEGAERQHHGNQGHKLQMGSKKALKGNVMAAKGKLQRAARRHGKAMLGVNRTFLEAAATFSRNSSTTSFSFCSSMTHDILSPAFQ